jgi:molybdopterin synthase sulfur carrier subunit
VTVAVRLFARARDLAGAEVVSLTLSRPVTVGRIRAALIARHPALQPLAGALLAAVNADYASEDREVTATCDLAFFPPVSGG